MFNHGGDKINIDEMSEFEYTIKRISKELGVQSFYEDFEIDIEELSEDHRVVLDYFLV